jgi:RNA polymerase sigma-70 factor (ECF subfamily)
MKTAVKTEKTLLKEARDLDKDALAQIYDLYSHELYQYAMRRLGDSLLAEECVADTFLRFLQVLRKNRGPKDYLKAYLYRIAHNWIVDHYRIQPALSELDEKYPSTGASLEEKTNKRLRAERLREVLSHLTPDQQQVIALKFLEEWTNKEVAKALRKPVGAIKSLQHRALVRLQKLLIDEEWL